VHSRRQDCPAGDWARNGFPRRHSAARQTSVLRSGFAQFGAQHLNVAGGSDALAELLHVRRLLIPSESCNLSEFETNNPVPIQAIGRLFKGDLESTIRTGKLAVKLGTRVVSVDDQPVHLTGKEYAILELLNLRKGTILTKEMFLNHLYPGMDQPGLKIIDVFVCKLRKKLAQATGGNHYIETVWGRGFVLCDPAATSATQKCGEEDLSRDL
jgi:DNA-binding winged helix-turn-helix (wHTH) protein